jgi:hypothetical protein
LFLSRVQESKTEKLSSSNSISSSSHDLNRDEKKDVHRLLHYWKQRESFGFVKIPDIEYGHFLFLIFFSFDFSIFIIVVDSSDSFRAFNDEEWAKMSEEMSASLHSRFTFLLSQYVAFSYFLMLARRRKKGRGRRRKQSISQKL